MIFTYETDRLILRILDANHAKEILEFYKNNRMQFEAVEPPRAPNFYTVEFHHSNLLQEYSLTLQRQYLRLYLFEKTNPDVIIGSVCFHNFRNSCFQSCTVGYKMDSLKQNKGYMTEALSYCLDCIIPVSFKIHRIEAMVLPSNDSSIRVLEKCGFEKEGISRDYALLNGVWQDHFRYSTLVYQ